MDLRIITPAETEQVTLAEARAHLRLPADLTDDDDLIRSLITAAREAAELFTGRAYSDAVYELRLDRWEDVVLLPVAPVTKIVRIEYLDAAGTPQPLAAGIAELDDHPDAPAVRLAYGQTWPALASRTAAVRIRFTADPEKAPVPRSVVQAMLLTIGHLYANTEDASTAQTHALVRGSESLLWPHRRNLGV